MLEPLNELLGSVLGSPWAFLAIFLACLIDAFFPTVPSDAVVIAAAAVAASGGRNLLVIILLAAVAAFLGDHVSYAIGRTLGWRAARRLRGGKRGRAVQAWAERTLRSHGGVIIVAARFIPGGRTATTLTAGTTRYPLPRFAAFDALAASLWATYAGLTGYIAGGLIKNNPLFAVIVGIGIAAGISVAVETVRYLLNRRRQSDAARHGPGDDRR